MFNGFRTNFSILSKTCDREFRFGMVITLSSVFQAYTVRVRDRLWFRMVFTLI